MTGQPYDDDDAEFDAFLQGKGPLAQGLAELTQPEPPAALDAAILARVAADLGQGGTADVRPGVTAVEVIAAGASTTATITPVTMASAVAPSSTAAANDDQDPADFQPRRWRERWRVPVALAAGITAISIALPLWRDDVAQQQAIQASMQEMHIPAMPAPMAEAHPPPEMAAPAPDSAAPAKDAAAPAATPATTGTGRAAPPPPAVMAIPSSQVAEAEAARNDAVAEKRKADDAGGERKAMERERAETRTRQQRASQAAPVAEAPPPKVQAPAPVAAPSSAAPPPAPVPAYIRTPAPIAAPAPAPQPQADYRAGAPAQSAPPATKPALAKQLADDAASQPLYPAAIVVHIEQLLKEGKRDAALAEWDRLRATYPDYPVPDKLREALGH